MQQNIKVDVIYYLSPSDFEMEFNLCGCCHMRLLNEKTQDRKELVKSLAKAVSRSKIILMCGPLFDENGLINIVSTAIGKTTEVINNADYGINYDDKISVIEGSTPLVTPDGLFGGCIIESGPQAIIVLSENKSVRKTIMNNLIHQYIYELSLLPEEALTRNAPQEQLEKPIEEQSASEEPVEEETVAEDINTEETKDIEKNLEYEDISSVSVLPETADEAECCDAEETVEETQEEIEEETEEETEEKDTPTAQEEQQENSNEPQEIEMYIDPQHVSPKKMADYAKNYVPSEKDRLFVSEEDYEYDYDIDDEDENFPALPKLNLSIILTVIVLSLIVVVLLYLMVYIPYSQGIDYASYIEQIFGPASNI